MTYFVRVLSLASLDIIEKSFELMINIFLNKFISLSMLNFGKLFEGENITRLWGMKIDLLEDKQRFGVGEFDKAKYSYSFFL